MYKQFLTLSVVSIVCLSACDEPGSAPTAPEASSAGGKADDWNKPTDEELELPPGHTSKCQAVAEAIASDVWKLGYGSVAGFIVDENLLEVIDEEGEHIEVSVEADHANDSEIYLFTMEPGTCKLVEMARHGAPLDDERVENLHDGSPCTFVARAAATSAYLHTLGRSTAFNDETIAEKESFNNHAIEVSFEQPFEVYEVLAQQRSGCMINRIR